MKTSARQKLLVSLINTAFIAILSLPSFIIFGISPEYSLIVVLLFLAYQLTILLFAGRRSLGAILTRTHWQRQYSLTNHIVYAVLYTLSFSTIVLWAVIPFDLLIVNLLLVQLPMVKMTGYTLHGYLSGKMVGVRTLVIEKD